MTSETHEPVLNPLGMTSHEFVAAARGRIVIGRLGGTPGAMLAYKQVMRDGLTRVVARASDAESAVVAEAMIPPIVQTHREESPEGEVIKFVTHLTVAKPEQTKDTTDEPMTPVSLDEGIATRMSLPVLGNEPVGGTGLGRDVSSRFEYLDIESVLIPMIGSKGIATYTLCVSSQVGCAMGCTFCETAQMGLIRSLTAAEIVSQWFNAQHVLKVPVKNIVFMGMGEPLDNLSNVIQAIAVLKDHNGAGVPISQITVSTVGRVDGLKRLSEKINEPGWHRLGLALSLNAPNDTVRSTIMPINRKWKMAELQEALLAWPRTSGNKVCVEYVLIPGVNDSRENAREIAEFLRPFGLLTKGRIGGTVVMAILNLIPYNPRRNSPWPAPTEERVDEFLGWLMEEGVFCKAPPHEGAHDDGRVRAVGERGDQEAAVGEAGWDGVSKPPIVYAYEVPKPPKRSWLTTWWGITLLVYIVLLGFSKRYEWYTRSTPFTATTWTTTDVLSRDGQAEGKAQIAYRQWSPAAAGVPVVLLHGSPGSAQDFDSLAPLIDPARRVIAPDLLGYGGTTGHIDDRSIKAYARIMLAMMDRLKIETVHVVGWSNGGGVALHMADLAPDRVVSITMLASIGLQEHEPSGSYEFEHFKYKAAKVIFGGLPELLPHFGLLGTYESRTAWADFFDDSDQRELQGVMERVGERGMPTLILHGRHDFLVPWFAAEDHFERIATSRLVMLEASHFIPFLQEDEASEVLDGWFARIEPWRLTPITKDTTWTPTAGEMASRGSQFVQWTSPLWRAYDDRSTQVSDTLVTHIEDDTTWLVRRTPWWAFLLAAAILSLRWRIATVVLGCVLVLHCWLDPFLLLTGVIASGVIRALVGAMRYRRAAHGSADRPPHVLIALLAAIFWPMGAMVVAIALDRFALAPVRHILGDGVLGVIAFFFTPLAIAIAVVIVTGLCSRAGRNHLRVSFERLIHHEYWPTQAFYFPFYPRFLWMAFRNGGVRQVTCCNPDIENGGGWAGESKVAIMEKLAPAGSVVLPTYLIPTASTSQERASFLRGLMARHVAIGQFPIVLKPNEAQRGHAFKLARSMEQAEQYLGEMTAAAVAQPYHTGPEECGIFWMRYSKQQLAAGRGPYGTPIPSGRLGFIYSITRKEFPRVIGDGERTLQRLVQTHPRYRRQAAVFLQRFAGDLTRVPARGEEVRLAISGNHCQGTLFRDGADLITPELEAETDRIARVFPRLDYGRFDVRFSSEDELKGGRGMAIIELNGSSSEPTNMYDPERSYFWALGVLSRMWQQVLELAKERRTEGVKPLTIRQFAHVIRENARGLKGSSIAD